MVFKYKKLLLLFTAFSLIYVLQVTMNPSPETLSRYHITSMQALLLGLAVAIPFILIWFVAFFGYACFRTYATAIRKSKEGPAFNLLSHGLLGLTLWLPLSAIFSNFTARVHQDHPALIATAVQLNTFVILILLMVTFILLYLGAKRLVAFVAQTPYSLMQSLFFVLFVAMVSIYAVFILHDPARYTPTATVPVASYYLPDWLIIITVLLPRVIMWTLGFLAVQYIYTYCRGAKGFIYKNSLQYVGMGLAFVITSSIIIRYLESLPSQLDSLGLGVILLLIYLLLILLAVGYALIAKGARRLQRIEEL